MKDVSTLIDRLKQFEKNTTRVRKLFYFLRDREESSFMDDDEMAALISRVLTELDIDFRYKLVGPRAGHEFNGMFVQVLLDGYWTAIDPAYTVKFGQERPYLISEIRLE